MKSRFTYCIGFILKLTIFFGQSNALIKSPNKNYASFIKKNAICLNSPTDSIYSDLERMKALLKDKQVVLLGESSHGVKEFSQYKIRLIKYLINELGFEVIGFESPIDEMEFANLMRDSFSSKELLKKSIYGVWHTEDNIELMSFIKKNKIPVFGFDPQFQNSCSKQLYKFCNIIASSEMNRLVEADSLFFSFFKEKKYLSNKNVFQTLDSFKIFQNKILYNYHSFLESFQSKSFDEDSMNYKKQFIIHLIKNRISYFQNAFINNKFSNIVRDSLMADNIYWFKQNIFKGKKIIIWAHNGHVSKNLYNLGATSIRGMGSFLYDKMPDLTYNIGIYMHDGEIKLNDKSSFVIKVNKKNSLENIFYQVPCDFSFLDISQQIKSKNNTWLFEEISTLDTGGITTENLSLKKSYDGILFIKTVHPPTYIKP